MKAINYFEKYRKLTNQCLNDIKQIFKENKTDKVYLYHDCEEENISEPLILPCYNNNGDIYNEEVQAIYINNGAIKIDTEYGVYDLENDCPRDNYISVYETLCEIFNIN